MRRYGLIGYPLSHSFSKKYFSEKFETEKITGCSYDLFPIQSITLLPELLLDTPELQGLNVTIPYKQSVLGYLSGMENAAKKIGACNCIKIREGKLTGYNTDVTGFYKSLQPLLQSQHERALILGNGGAAAAVKYALDLLHIPYSIVSRNKQPGDFLGYADLNKEILVSHKLIINTTPLGMAPQTGTCPDLPYEFITREHLLYDLVYNPAKTLFLQKGEEQGADIKNGYEMLVMQAEESWRIWNED